jgi:uncharacterized protein YfaS (alpha-2-macroglobulin family)
MNRRRLPLAFISLILTLCFFGSCEQTKKEIDYEFAKYIAAFTYGNIHSSSEIQIELMHDVPAVELNQEVSQDLFKFSPSIKGKAYWTSTRTIKFVPEPGALKSGQEYDAWFKLGKVMQVESKFKEFYFHFFVPEQNFKVDVYPYSPMKDNDLVWNTVQGKLTLADDAGLDNINKMFSISGGQMAGTKINITPTETKGVFNIQIDSLRRERHDVEYVLKVDGSPIGVKREDQLPIAIPKIGAPTFEVIDVDILKEAQGAIRVTFSEPLSVNQNIQGLIRLNDAQNYSYDIQKNVLKVYLDNYRGGSNIDLKLFKEMKSADGKWLDKDYTYSLTFERNKPEVKLMNSGNILPNSNSLIIPFQAVNLWAVDVKVIKIFENNILGYLQANDFGESSELRRFGRLILKKRIRLDVDPTMKLDEWNNFSLDLAKMIKQDPGAIYRVEFSIRPDYSLYPCEGEIPQVPAEASLERFETLTEDDIERWDSPGYYYYDDDDYYYDYVWSERDDPCKKTYYRNKKSSCLVMASNIGMTAKVGTDRKMLVALNDIITTKPISGAKVDIYNYQMQRVGSAQTDGNGFAHIEYKGVTPFAVIATHGKEKGYLKVTSNLSLSLSNFDVSGKELQKGLKGYIYGERGVWRPGDSIFLTFILEDKNKTLPKEHPVSLEFYNPRGQLDQQTVATAGKDGFYTFPIKTSADAITGNWQARIKVGGATFSKTIKVETIKPNRLKIRLDMGEMIDASSGSMTASLSSQWLHGAPASNLKADVEMTLSSVRSPFKDYPAYSFNNPASNFYSDTYTIFNGKLDASGNATIKADLPQAASAPGMLRANFISRVYESGGDASIYMQTAAYSPYSSYVGVKSPTDYDYQWLETDRDNVLDIVTITPDGKPVNRKEIRVKAYKLRWSWWWNSSNDNLSSYVNSTSAEVVLDKTISTTGKGQGKVSLRIDYPEWGRYLVMAEDLESGHIAGKILYIDWPEYRGRSNKQDSEGSTMLSFSTDKQKYNVGEKATVILPKSSNGRALITLEDGTRVISKGWATTSAEEDTKYTFTVTEEMAPNFYVYASLLQPHAQTENESPIRMYGVLNVSVENKETILHPVISMADELRPEKEFSVSISEKDKKEMTYTLAVVDDGLLDLTAFKTPNAWADFYSRQALGVRTWDMFDMVVGAHSGKLGPLLSIGGDESLDPKKDAVNRFKPVVKFLGPFTLAKGKTDTHKITLPPYVGSVRVMVVAGSSKGAYGNAEKTVQVKNPLMILSTLPRVAGPGEEILLPVNVFAMDAKVKDVKVSVQSQGLFEFVDGTSKSVAFTETGDKMVYFKVKVAKKIGAEKVVIKATGGGESATETIEIEIRNPNPPVILASGGLVNAGATTNLNIAMDSPQPEDWVKLEVSRLPSMNLNKNIRYLLDYPHGCSEQVTSQVFPMLYVSTFMPLTEKEKEKIDFNIKEGIKILSARQLSDGGIVYWPGNRYPTEWVTTYAGHFLVEAKRKGYDVPQSVIDKWKRFQKKAAQNWNMRDMYNSYYSYSMSDLQQAYRLYTLALAEDPELGAMNRLKEMKDLTIQARWRLAAAYAVAGKKDAANQLISGASDIIDAYTFNNNTYGSSSRDMAMIMETQLLLGSTERALKLSYKVADYLSGDYVSTQTLAYGLIAMSKLAEKMGQGVISYDWELNGVKQKTGSTGKPYEEIVIKPQEKIDIKFTNNSKGQLFVRLTGYTKPFEDKTPAQNKGVNLYVTYTNENGQKINITSLEQGEEFYANVVVQNISGQYLTDMALSQIFPSGWEIFNQRLFDAGNNTGQSYTYQDIRDDRVLTYFNIGAGYSSSFKVKLQAAYCGRFYLPAVMSEAMYSPDLQSRTTGHWVEVVQP